MAKKKKRDEKDKKSKKKEEEESIKEVEEELEDEEEQLSAEKDRDESLDNVLEAVESEFEMPITGEIDLSLSSGQTTQLPSGLQQAFESERLEGIAETEQEEGDDNPTQTIYEQMEQSLDEAYGADTATATTTDSRRISIDEGAMPTTATTTSRSVGMIDVSPRSRGGSGEVYEVIDIENREDSEKMPWENQAEARRREKMKDYER